MPKNILFYRDGVSESQFPMVRKDELPEIRSACNEFATAYRLGKWSPKITLVVCTKRHQTRFFGPESKDEQAEKAALLDDNGGFMPGLVVDDPSVRLPYYFDFFLQSHKTLQGTARPCHYFVIENQMGLDADTLQEIVSCETFSWHNRLVLTFDSTDLRSLLDVCDGLDADLHGRADLLCGQAVRARAGLCPAVDGDGSVVTEY